MYACIWDHRVLPTTRHKWTHPGLTPARHAGARFTYPGGMEGWVDLVYLLTHSLTLSFFLFFRLWSSVYSCQRLSTVIDWLIDCMLIGRFRRALTGLSNCRHLPTVCLWPGQRSLRPETSTHVRIWPLSVWLITVYGPTFFEAPGY